jgi:hypothetical protein
MTKEEIIRMARWAEIPGSWDLNWFDPYLERFAALVAAHEREKVAKWMVERSYATGHGDTVEDLLKELEWQVAEREREECAKVCEAGVVQTNNWDASDWNQACKIRAAAIRARGTK